VIAHAEHRTDKIGLTRIAAQGVGGAVFVAIAGVGIVAKSDRSYRSNGHQRLNVERRAGQVAQENLLIILNG
jgi:hypothetical protein